ncbi:hypothetical protein KPB2_5361 [Klebsiella pneumoniae Kb677]|nr:hypothetical protein KPB2_5361 [Klebsiella pneumoniae Kb677]
MVVTVVREPKLAMVKAGLTRLQPTVVVRRPTMVGLVSPRKREERGKGGASRTTKPAGSYSGDAN